MTDDVDTLVRVAGANLDAGELEMGARNRLRAALHYATRGEHDLTASAHELSGQAGMIAFCTV